MAALFPSTVVSVKSSHGGGACPVTTGELHPSRGYNIYHSTIHKTSECKTLFGASLSEKSNAITRE